MGCNSSAPAAEPGSKAAASKKKDGKKGIVGSEVRWEYFEGFGRGDPLTQMFEYHGQSHQKTNLDFGGWEARKQRGDGGEFGGGLPQAYVTEGGKTTRMAQFGAILRSFGIRFGYYNPKDWRQARYIDPLIDSWSDLQGKLGAVAFAPDEEAKGKAFEAFLAFVKKFNGLVEANLNHHGGKFVAGNEITVGDFVVAAYVGNYCLKNPMFAGSQPFTAALDDTPKTKAYANMIIEALPHLKNRTQQYPF